MDKVVHFEIPAQNVVRARKFYSEVFGWKMTPVPDMDYTMAQTTAVGKDRMPREKGAINGGMMKRTARVRAPVITMGVRSIDASLAKLRKKGGKVVMPSSRSATWDGLPMRRIVRAT